MVAAEFLALFWLRGKRRTRRQWEHALMLAKARVSDGPDCNAKSRGRSTVGPTQSLYLEHKDRCHLSELRIFAF
jgi:hypothetical protein